MTHKKRVLLIGLDGFTWRLGRDFMAEGVMPVLARMAADGCSGNLQSVFPFETGPAWSSFQTGCFPGKTDVFAFHTYDRNRRVVRLNSFSDIAVPSVWQLADRAGKTVVSLNMPVSSPPPRVRGIIIPGLLCPKLSPATVHPAEAYDKYIRPHKDYLIVNHDWQDTVAGFADQAIAAEQVRCEVALAIMKDVDWDIFFVQIQSGDPLQHKVWWALDPDAPGHSTRMRNEALRFYRSCDEIIGRLVDAAGAETLTLIASDHGFCMKKAEVGINTWLRRKGYLQYVTDHPATGLAAARNRLKENHPVLKSLAGACGRLHKNVSSGCKRLREKMRKPGSTRIYAETLVSHIRTFVDFEKTRAFCLGGMGGMIYINGDARERTTFGRQLAGELLDALGPGSEQPVIAGIRTSPEVYGVANPPCHAPDLVVEFAAGCELRIHPGGDEVVLPGVFKGNQQGTHSRQGVFVVRGPAVRAAGSFDADIVDIVPTVLAYMDVPVPRHVDGTVLNNAFSEPLHVVYEDVTCRVSSATDYSDDEQAEVEKHLHDLGYM